MSQFQWQHSYRMHYNWRNLIYSFRSTTSSRHERATGTPWWSGAKWTSKRTPYAWGTPTPSTSEGTCSSWYAGTSTTTKVLKIREQNYIHMNIVAAQLSTRHSIAKWIALRTVDLVRVNLFQVTVNLEGDPSSNHMDWSSFLRIEHTSNSQSGDGPCLGIWWWSYWRLYGEDILLLDGGRSWPCTCTFLGLKLVINSNHEVVNFKLPQFIEGVWRSCYDCVSNVMLNALVVFSFKNLAFSIT